MNSISPLKGMFVIYSTVVEERYNVLNSFMERYKVSLYRTLQTNVTKNPPISKTVLQAGIGRSYDVEIWLKIGSCNVMVISTLF